MLVKRFSLLFLLANLVSCASIDRRAVDVCEIVSSDQALPPMMECTLSDGRETELNMREANGYLCSDPINYMRRLKR